MTTGVSPLEIRLNKFLSEAGVASRRGADRLILEGRVKVNGQVAAELGTKVDPERDVVEVDGRRIQKKGRPVYILLYKPPGYLVTRKDPFRRRTVLDLVPPDLGRVFPVGRLDLASEGLILLTTDGELAYRLSHPRYEVKKTYLARVRGEPTAESIGKIKEGIWIEGKKRAPARIDLLFRSPKSSWLRIELHEGRKHEVRLMCRAIGHEVQELKRVALAGLTLKKMKKGQWRYLEPREVRQLKNLVGLHPQGRSGIAV